MREGYCTVPNPFNSKQVSRISLLPQDVDIIIFWTKNSRPLFPYLQELDSYGYQYGFQYTLNGYPTVLEPYLPELETRIKTFIHLSKLLGPEKLIWRYDPIIISNITGIDYHKQMFMKIAQALKGRSKRVIISLVDSYRKAAAQFKILAKQGIYISEQFDLVCLEDLMCSLVNISQQNGFAIQSCAEIVDLSPWGVSPGKCIDGGYIKHVFGLDLNLKKDKNQRRECGCLQSKDIGVYGTCLHGCRYCYAGTFQMGLKNFRRHEVNSSSLIHISSC